MVPAPTTHTVRTSSIRMAAECSRRGHGSDPHVNPALWDRWAIMGCVLALQRDRPEIAQRPTGSAVGQLRSAFHLPGADALRATATLAVIVIHASVWPLDAGRKTGALYHD